MIVVNVVRSFSSMNGAAPTEAICSCDLADIPPVGTTILFQDGTGVALVAAVRVSAWHTPRPPGVYPGAVAIRCPLEPAERLAAALTARREQLKPGATTAGPA